MREEAGKVMAAEEGKAEFLFALIHFAINVKPPYFIMLVCVRVYVRTCVCARVCVSCVVVVAIAIALVGHRLAFNFRFYCVETIVWYWFGYELSESSPASACQDEHKHSVGGCRARNFPHLNIKFAWGSCFANACGSICSVSRCLLKSNHNRTTLILRTNLNEPIFPS